MDAYRAELEAEIANFSIKDLEKLYPFEQRWVNRQPWLLQRGYQLRPCFRPGWEPSWRKHRWIPSWVQDHILNPYDCEDSVILDYGELIMDAERVKDGSFVAMKLINKSVHPYELEISSFLSSAELANDPRNHCVPLVDSFDAPDDPTRAILVMPLLRKFDDPPFETVRELVECLLQLFEELEFMHEHNVAHRYDCPHRALYDCSHIGNDCTLHNNMMDATPMYPVPFHPSDTDRRRDRKGDAKHFSRTQRPVKYYFIDFGLSRQYDPANDPPRELPIIPGDKSVPEHQGAHYDEPSDPFATDVYLLGNLIRKQFLKRCTSDNLHFLDPLASEMALDNPEARPAMHEVVTRFIALRDSLDATALSSRLAFDGVTYRSKPHRALFLFFSLFRRRV